LSPRSLKLVCILPSLQSGGAERVMSILANAWCEQNTKVSILTFEYKTSSPFYKLDSRIEVLHLGIASPSSSFLNACKNNLRTLFVLRKEIQKQSPSHIISFLDKTNIRVLFATIGLSIPVIVSEHSVPGERRLGILWETLRLLSYSLATKIILLSKSIESFFPLFLQKKCSIIPNPVLGPDLGSPELKLPENTILSLGRFSREKCFPLLIEAFAQIAKNYPDWSLVIIGDGPEREKLEKQILQSNLSERILLPGKITFPTRVMQHAKFFVSTSFVEGFPMAVCEAMSCGVPVIATKSRGAIEEIITHGKNGLLIERNSIEELVAQLKLLIENPSLRGTLGTSAKDITNRYSLSSVLALWNEILEHRL
jgi:GalNAc-alpha-(1->4)-GalNAc-alpha-(1->3)-diNAcBac-PP-undecaprenol alpha-1,4-N-acetyl-D-galactosaminyltransferase